MNRDRAARLASSAYGKSRIRLVRVRRDREPHDIADLTIDVQLEGAFERVYTDGDNSVCLATDTMKNTVYAFARREPIDHVEAFAARLAQHFASRPAVARARVSAEEQPWDRLTVDARPHPHAFAQHGPGKWTAVATCDAGANAATITSGIADVVLLKTTDSAFEGYPRDEYTTLPETRDRIFATSLTSSWVYRPGAADFAVRDRIRTALLETFAAHVSRSVQHTLYAMGAAALEACDDITAVTLSMPNRHHLLVDLAPFGLDNPNEVFVATDQPFGLIEATLSRR